MIKCQDCIYHFRPTIKLPDGTDQILDEGVCRFFPPSMIVVPSAAVFGQISASPLDPGVPGWTVGCNVGAVFPQVKNDWSCGQGKERE